jgi:methyltransferase family protein
VIAESPYATRLATCAWCEQPLPTTPPARCPACGAVADQRPRAIVSEAELARFAAPEHRHATSGICSLGEAARRRARRHLAARIARGAPPGAVLDVASGDVMLLDALRATGRLATAIDRPARRAGVQDAEITELGGRYAAIVFWQSLGRVRAPGRALEHAASLLKPGGLLAIAQPCPVREHVRALGMRWLARGGCRQPLQIPAQSLLDRLGALGLQVERVDRRLDDAPVGGLVGGMLGGILSIEARR